MIISQKQNLLYKDRLSHKHKSLVTTEQSSNHSLKETPLLRESNDISFKGVSPYLSKYLYKQSRPYNIPKNVSEIEKYTGKAIRRLTQKIDSWKEMENSVVKIAQTDLTVLKEKNWFKLLADGIAYPFTELPLHIFASLRKLFAGKNAKKLEESNTFLGNHLKVLKNTEILNSLSGYMDTVERFKFDSSRRKSAGFFTNAMKMFNPGSGNYNGVHERALTRIVTGFIPAFFLANDAYNLSRICDDDPKAAEKEKKTRFNQETKRVLSNAYIQLITLGALSKYINRSKGMFIGVTAASVLLTESLSRLSNGKKLYFMGKDAAIKMNEKEAQKNGIDISTITKKESADTREEKAETAPASSIPAFKGSSKVFNSFGLISDMPWASTNVNMAGNKGDKKEIKELKPLISLPTITKWFVATIAAGFAIKYGKKVVLKNGNKIGDYFNVISKRYDKIYSKITKKDYEITRQEFKKVVDKLKTYDEVLAQKFEEVVAQSQKSRKISKLSDEFSEVLEKAGLKRFAEEFKHIANERLEDTFENIGLKNAAKQYFKERNKSIIKENVLKLIGKMQTAGLLDEANELKNIFFNNNNFDITQYSRAKKMLNEAAKQCFKGAKINDNAAMKKAGYDIQAAAFSLENRFKVDQGYENIKVFEKALEELKKINPELAQKYETSVLDAVNAEVLSLGKKNKKGIKQAADFVTEPFSFIWGTITLPYKHVANKIAKLFDPAKLPEWEDELQAVANGVTKLTHKPKFSFRKVPRIDLPEERFTKYMDEQINKGFNTATMSSISNSDLSALAKNTSTAATAWFLMADNYNMVMQKTNGDGKKDAVLKAKERAIQETSRSFYSVLFIQLFNNTFKSLYNSSLFGAQNVNTASTLIGEYVNRKSIGMPVKESSRDEIVSKEYENITSKGPKGRFFRFMSRLTGKKVLSQRDNVKKQQITETK